MILIRRASPEDAEQLTRITLASKRYWNYPEEWIQRWLPELIFLPEYVSEHEMWLAVMGERSAAYYSLKQSEDSFWLENLWVLPEYIGQGMGRMLFQHALERSRVLGASTLKIESDPHAQNFYEKMGARKVSEHQYELDGHLRVLPIMEINL